jgi:WD40 repeat protein
MPSEPADTDQSPFGTLAQSPEEQSRAAAVSSKFGVTVPGFEIEGELGRGGMGVVFKAKQTGLNRLVALKMVLAGSYSDAATRSRFLLEAESVAALEHPNIVKVFSFGEHDGHPFLAMEFLPAGSLADRVKAKGPLPPREATALIAKLAGAVAHAHSRGVVHRDMKPANVLLTAEGDPRLTDFGLAKVGRSDISMTGQVLGTPAYMAPEQAAGKVHEVGTPADVYALGAVLYDLLTGHPPFAGNSAAATLHMVLVTEPSRPRTLRPGLPRDLETICLKCLEKDPNKRYPTAQAVADDLNRFLASEPISARPAGSVERAVKWVKRNKGLSVGLAVASLALVLGTIASIGFALWAMDEAERATRKARAEHEAREQVARSEKKALTALEVAQAERLKADRGQAELEFSRAMTSCEEGRLRQGLGMFVRVVELAEANAAAEELDGAKEKEFDRELARVARLNLAAWERQLPPTARSFPHKSHQLTAAIVPGGKLMVTAGYQHQVSLWDLATGTILQSYNSPRTFSLSGIQPSFWSVAVNTNGTLIAAGSSTGQIVVWDKDSPQFRHAFEARASVEDAKAKGRMITLGQDIFSVSFAPDGTLWATDGESGIQQWDLAAKPQPKMVTRLVLPGATRGGPIANVMALTSDGTLAYTGDRAGQIQEWNLRTKMPGRAFQAPGWVQDLAVSPDGKYLAATGPSGKIRLFALSENKPPTDLDLFGAGGNGLAFAPNQPILVSTEGDGNIRFWHRETGQPVGAPLRVPGDPRPVRFQPGADQFVFPAGGMVWLSSIPNPGKLVARVPGDRIRGLGFSPNGDRIALASGYSVQVLDAATLQLLQPPAATPELLRGLKCGGDPKQPSIVRGYINAFDRMELPTMAAPEIHRSINVGAVRQIEFSIDGKSFYLLGDAVVVRHDTKTLDLIRAERPVKDLPPGIGFKCMAIHPKGDELAVVHGQKVAFIDPEKLQIRRPGWAAGDEVRAIAYTSDGKGALVGRRDNMAELLDAVTGRPLVRPMPHERALTAVETSPDGKLFVTGSRDETARFWDSRTGLPIGPPLRHASEVLYLRLDPRGNRLLTGTGDGTAMLWELPPSPTEGTLAELRARFGVSAK